MIKRELYKVENNKLIRERRFCPRCGPGVFLAEHADRYACGRCGYTEIKKEQKAPQKSEQKGKQKKQA
ncbi:MAG TPA: 30S ribosomal protein S27ae [Thermoplasmataceae archaeon]|nr:30S ribosomal protein S27ae [Thermoplasmatales archaeon AK]HLH86105.1 30S ribosomal protein S27ae [Thermoplasmataceae archaeon]